MRNTIRALVWATLTLVAVGCVSVFLFAVSIGTADTGLGFLVISTYFMAISIAISLPLSFAVCTLMALPLYFLLHRAGIGSLKLYLAAAFIVSLAFAAAARVLLPTADKYTSSLIFVTVLVAGPLAALVFWRTAETPLRR